ncbi:hypothetical protein [Novosphingobium sp. THN1]|uniref:hypothetical protein n=1 Tax=Novosphingobium sp. THN1 TaxID=1016987 RepID=UPI0013C313D6|nr:hypothetical protein [Novosphingobium sp. THN1]
MPGRNDDASNGIPILRTPDGKALLRAAPVSLIGRVETTETDLAALESLVGDAPLHVVSWEPRIVPGKASARQPLVKTPEGRVLIWDRPVEVSDAITAIDTRISRTLDANGMPLAPIYGNGICAAAGLSFRRSRRVSLARKCRSMSPAIAGSTT